MSATFQDMRLPPPSALVCGHFISVCISVCVCVWVCGGVVILWAPAIPQLLVCHLKWKRNCCWHFWAVAHRKSRYSLIHKWGGWSSTFGERPGWQVKRGVRGKEARSQSVRLSHWSDKMTKNIYFIYSLFGQRRRNANKQSLEDSERQQRVKVFRITYLKILAIEFKCHVTAK